MLLYEPLFVILWIDFDVFCLRVLVSVFSFTACSMLSVLRSLISIFIHIYIGRGILYPGDKRKKTAYKKESVHFFMISNRNDLRKFHSCQTARWDGYRSCF